MHSSYQSKEDEGTDSIPRAYARGVAGVCLKINFWDKKITFSGLNDIGGFSSLEQFKRKYSKLMTGSRLKPRKAFQNVKFLFIIDDDLEDSPDIKEFLRNEGHFIQSCKPNTEGMLLQLVGKPQVRTTMPDDFRKKCKDEFKKYFSCEAHKIRSEQLSTIFISEKIFKDALPDLHGLLLS